MRHFISAFVIQAVLLGNCTAQSAGQARADRVSVDSAMANLRVIAGEIGPRPMGSPAEHRAMEFALERLKAFGCDDTFLLPMDVAGGVNTTSGIAVGVLKGESGRTILIGGHMDSAGPEIPGADDDGSGSALVLELARVLAQRRHHSTLMFCLWGGEEQGLRGSSYFVAHYPGIDSVALMLQLDMVDGKGPLDIDPDAPYQVSSPRWLVNAAFEEFYNVLHYSGLRYPTQFATINASGGGATGSDHIPFIEHGIPAIDFTSDVEYPIHTPLDNLSNFTPSGFQRAGDLILRLVDRFDTGQPAVKTEEYWLVQLGDVPLFIPQWFISLFTALSIGAAILLGVLLFRKERNDPSLRRFKGSGAKVALAVLIVNAFVWMAPNIVGLFTGYRFPWAGRFGLYEVFSITAGFLGVWLAIRLLRVMRPSDRVAPMFVRAAIALAVASGCAAAFGLEIAMYPALILALMTLAIWLRRPWLGTIALILGGCIAYSFVFSEATGLFQRALTATAPDVLVRGVVYHLSFILLSSLLTLPFGYAGAALVRAVGRDFLHLHSFTAPRVIAVLGMVVIAFGIYVGSQKPYGPSWQPSVIVRQGWNIFDTSGVVRIMSSEPFHDLRVLWESRDTVLPHGTEAEIFGPPIDPAHWVDVACRDSIVGADDSTTSLTRTLVVTTPVRPYQVSVTFESKSPFEATSWRWSSSQPVGMLRSQASPDRRKVFRWYAFPASPLVIPVELHLHRNQSVIQYVEVTFDTLATPVMLENLEGYCTRRMVITRTDSLRGPGLAGGLAEAERP